MMSQAPNTFSGTVLELLEQHRIEAALELAADGVRTFPTYIGGYVLLARCYALMGHTEDAEVILAEANLRFPNRLVIEQVRRSIGSARVPEAATTDAVDATDAIDISDTIETPPTDLEPSTAVEEHDDNQPTEVAENPVTPEQPQPAVVLVPQRQNKRSNQPTERKESPLRMIELAPPTADKRLIRSSAVRLIPGLEFTSLRFEGSRSRGRRSVSSLPEPPPWRTFNTPLRPSSPSQPVARPQRKVSLEELANKLNSVRLTASELENRPPAPDPLSGAQKPSLVTETLANIYESQGNYEKAIEAFHLLSEQHPNKADEFQKRIAACKKAQLDAKQ